MTPSYHHETRLERILNIACILKIHHVMNKVMNIYNALIKSSLLYGSETWRLTENSKRWIKATEMDALRRSSRILTLILLTWRI